MTTENQNTNRDEVLFAFNQACERPTAEQIIEWTKRYPQFAEDIRAHAAVSRDWAAREGLLKETPDKAMLERGFSTVLNILYGAEVAAAKQKAEKPKTFLQLAEERRKDLPQLAREIDIGRSVLADLFGGRMLPPVGGRLAAAIVTCLAITHEVFDKALQLALSHPGPAHAKSDKTPAVIPRSYEDIIRDSNMKPERKQFWLSKE